MSRIYSEREYAGIEHILAKIFAKAMATSTGEPRPSSADREGSASRRRATSEDLCWHGPESDGDKRLTPPSTT